MNPSSTALQGLHLADLQLEEAAARIADASASSPEGANIDIVGLSIEIVALMSAQTLFEANLTTLESASQMQKTLIDTTA